MGNGFVVSASENKNAWYLMEKHRVTVLLCNPDECSAVESG